MGTILIVDDEQDIRDLISDILQDEGYATQKAAESDTAFEVITKSPPDLIILDIWLKDSRLDGIEILKAVKRDNPGIPIVIISGHGNIELAVAAIKQGAYDFIEKPFNIDQLLVVISRAMEASKLRRENAALRQKDVTNTELVGSSSVIRATKQQLERVARTNGRIMLTGPSGCGKEVAARYIHSFSNRADQPFVSVNCATISGDKFEDILFGNPQSDTGGEKGLLEQADGGVIYFDEVADMPSSAQSKILRVLVDQSFRRSSGEKTRVDLRVIASTNKNLEEEIAAGRFREDLYHRLNVVPIEVPPLESRLEDIPELIEFFQIGLQADQGLKKRVFSEDALVVLQTMPWPGNVRQLKNLVERLLILGNPDDEITADELPGTSKPKATDDKILPMHFASMSLRDARELFERGYLTTQIGRFGGNISKTASFIGMERSALHRKLKTLGLADPSRRGTGGDDDVVEEAAE
ncbi:MAG: sigma-54 dependent transcriptional regulator [Pseudomonadota bacterium]